MKNLGKKNVEIKSSDDKSSNYKSSNAKKLILIAEEFECYHKLKELVLK